MLPKQRLMPGLALLLLATGLQAQSAQVWRDSIQRLSVRVSQLRDSMLGGDSTVKEVARRGDLVIGAAQSLRTTAAEALEQFDRARQRWFGNATPSEDGFRIVIRSDESQGSGRLAQVATIVLAGMPDTGRSSRTERGAYPNQVAEALIERFAAMMFEQAGPKMMNWLQQAPPVGTPDKERRYVAMYAFVTGTGKAQRSCVSGGLDECAYALGLRTPKISDPGGGYVPFLRADLVMTALETGGPNAWNRFQGTSSDEIEPMLAAAAGMPLDSLLSRWRSQLLSLRPTEAPFSTTRLVLGLTWMVLLLLGSLGASRWQ